MLEMLVQGVEARARTASFSPDPVLDSSAHWSDPRMSQNVSRLRKLAVQSNCLVIGVSEQLQLAFRLVVLEPSVGRDRVSAKRP